MTITTNNLSKVSKPSGLAIKLSDRADAGQTVGFLFEDIEKNAEQLRPLLANVAVYDANGILLLNQTLRKLWDFCRKHIEYKFDPKNQEVLYSPRRVWHQKFGDCDDQTKFLLCFLFMLKIPFKIRIVGYNKNRGFAHVFPVSWTENGKEIILDYVPECQYFGHTPPYLFYKDFHKKNHSITTMETVYLDGAGDGTQDLNLTVEGFQDDGQPINTGTGVGSTEDFQEAAAELGGADGDDAEITNGYNHVTPLNGSFTDWFKNFGAKTRDSKKVTVRTTNRKELKQGAILKLKTYIAQAASTLKNWTQAPQLPELSPETVKQEITALAQMQAAYENRPELLRIIKARVQANTFLKPFYLSLYSSLRHISKTGQLKGIDEDLNAAELDITTANEDALNGLDYDYNNLNGAGDEESILFAGANASDDDLTELGLRREYTSDLLSAARRVKKAMPDKAAARTAVIAALQEGAGILFLPLVLPKEDKQLSKSAGVRIKAAKAKKAMAELVKATGASKQEIEYAIKVGVSNVYTGIVAAVNQLKADNALAGFEEDVDGVDNAIYSQDLGAPKFLRRVTNKLAALVPTVANNAFRITPAGQFASIVAPNLNTKIQNLTAQDTAKAFADVRNIFRRRKAKETPQQVAERIRMANRQKITTALNKLNAYLTSNKLVLDDLVTPFDVKAENLKGSELAAFEEPIANAEAEEVENVGAADDAKTFTERAKEFYTANKKKIWIGVILFVVGGFLVWFYSSDKKKKRKKRSGSVNGAVGKIPTTRRTTRRKTTKRKPTAASYPNATSRSSGTRRKKKSKAKKSSSLSAAKTSTKNKNKGKKSKPKTAGKRK